MVAHVRAAYDVDMVTVGIGGKCDVIGTDLKTLGSCGSVDIDGRTVNVPLAGKANILNVLLAWAVCKKFISLSDFIGAVEFLRPYEGRLAPMTIGPLMVLDDCYNANPVSMHNALYCLHSIAKDTGKRAVFIAGCMAELGNESELHHEQLGRNVADHEVKVLLAAGPFAEHIVQGVSKAAKDSLEAVSFQNTDQLCDNLHKWIQPDDIILVKGSRSARLERAIERLKELF